MDKEEIVIGLAELNTWCTASYQQTGNDTMKRYADCINGAIMIINRHCENCAYAQPTDIDGLIDCDVDGRSKDDDMFCDAFEPKKKQ